MPGLYIHIPFCASRCIYCGFYSTTSLQMREKYVDAICKEMRLRADYANARKEGVGTIYLGGGTPSQLSFSQLNRIFDTISEVFFQGDASLFSHVSEFTIECNPDDITSSFADFLAHSPVNRVSMGAQSFSDDRLKFLHRRHNATEVSQAVALLRASGIKNISLDLIFGFPKESLQDWISDIETALSLAPGNISAYSLMYEEGTPLYRMLQERKIKEVDEELSLAMYNTLVDRLCEAGYEHYEISNFALPGFSGKHNTGYWHNTPYLGIGAAAHSYDLNSRQWNVSDLKAYIEAIEKGNIPKTTELLDDDTRYDDLVTTTLRTREGIAIQRLKEPYKHHLLENARPYVEQELMAVVNDHLKLTRKGIFISDTIMSSLMYV